MRAHIQLSHMLTGWVLLSCVRYSLFKVNEYPSNPLMYMPSTKKYELNHGTVKYSITTCGFYWTCPLLGLTNEMTALVSIET